MLENTRGTLGCKVHVRRVFLKPVFICGIYVNERLLSGSKFSSRTDVKPDITRYIVTAVSFKGLGQSSEISPDNGAHSISVRRRYEFLQDV